MELNFEGIAVGAASLLVIGAFHPLVIWCEYHFSQKIWRCLHMGCSLFFWDLWAWLFFGASGN